ncbi:uncharacterized protein PV06_02317 [Exophiala oligosperma]|uniref:Arylsulfotransferase n=1 Tax=Exophiala oligosperma TaxID=215243 RepID=A0A0D2DVM2_9EURO|nr:uncharacterized protein PV06_02317 [Exophiala oligosperma]KIW46665.1 hypothetical protein PV06_02317 [Exophiala oligosperma]
MKSSLLCAAVSVLSWTAAAFSFNAYDLGFHGLYPRKHFHSVDFEAPAPKITQWDSRCDYGNLFFTPRGPWVQGAARGPIITDPRGNLVWMDNHRFEQAMNFNVQKYRGQDYLTFWTKHRKTKHGKPAKHSKKSYVMLNSSYEVAYRIHPHGKKLKGDSHEFRITPQGTALITIYHKHQADCTDLKLGKSCWIQDGMFQEIDIETGKLLFEWRATDHIGMTDVFSSPNMKDGHGKSKADAFDFFHINSVDKTDSGDYVISARYMHAVVCISGKTGEVIWQLGGKNNDFRDLNHALDFAWQHHVTWQGNNTLSIFDNHANNVFHSPSSHSKGMIIKLDLEKMTATLVGKYVHPDKILNVSQGSVQVVNETGTVLVGFGNSPTYVEYSPEGKVLCAAHFAPHIAFEIIDFGLVKSYRIFKHPWVGKPKTNPAVKVKSGKAYVSWNGATEVSSWRLEKAAHGGGAGAKGGDDAEFVTIEEARRDGFETSFNLDKIHGHVRIAALDGARGVMAYSAVVKTPSPSHTLLWSSFILVLCFMGLAVLYRRRRQIPHISIPNLKLLDFKHRLHSITIKKQAVALDDLETESSPLLLAEREPEP